MANGGKRAGAGRKKGYKAPATLDKLAARELTRQRVTEALVPMLVCRRRPPRRELVLRALLRRGVWPKGMLPRRDVVEARRPKRAWCAATARSMISWKAGR